METLDRHAECINFDYKWTPVQKKGGDIATWSNEKFAERKIKEEGDDVSYSSLRRVFCTYVHSVSACGRRRRRRFNEAVFHQEKLASLTFDLRIAILKRRRSNCKAIYTLGEAGT